MFGFGQTGERSSLALGGWNDSRGCQLLGRSGRGYNIIGMSLAPSPPLLAVRLKGIMALAVEFFVADFLERRADLDYDSAAWVVTRVAKRCGRQGSGIKQDK